MEERVKKFKSIFYGLDRAYGQYKSDGQLVNGKAGGHVWFNSDIGGVSPNQILWDFLFSYSLDD